MSVRLPQKRLLTLISLLMLVSIGALAFSAAAAAQSLRCVDGDGRINNRPPRDCAAPVLIYLRGDQIVVLTATQGPDPGVAILEASRNTEIPASANAIIAQGTNPLTNAPVVISRLTTGEYQLNTFFPDSSAYIVVWYNGATDLYHIDPATGQPLDGAQPVVAPNAPNPSGGAAAAAPIAAASDPTTTLGARDQGDVAEGLENCRVTVRRMVRIRTEPSTTTGVVMATLPYRTTYKVTDRIEGWYKVIYLDTQGWVSAEFLTPSGCD